MTYVAAEARRELLDDIAAAAARLAQALAELGAAYEALDEPTGDRLEEQLFRPVQLAFGRAQRTHTGFAARHGIAVEAIGPGREPPANRPVRDLVAAASAEVTAADDGLSVLQDSLRPVEVGDAELRADLGDVRRRLTPLPGQARAFLGVLGR